MINKKLILKLLKNISYCEYFSEQKNGKNHYIYSQYSGECDEWFRDINNNYDLIKWLVDNGYVDGKEIINIDDENLQAAGVNRCHHYYKIIGLTKKGQMLLNSKFFKFRCFWDYLESTLKPYPQTSSLSVSMCSGGLAGAILTLIIIHFSH